MQGNSHEHKITQNDMNSAVDLHYQESIIMFLCLVFPLQLCEDVKIIYNNSLC